MSQKISFKQLRIAMLFLLVLSLLTPAMLHKSTWLIEAASPDKIRVACIGDSITYGTLIHNRPYNSYPSQLNRLLGHQYQVMNYGVNGYTMLNSSDRPYQTHANYQKSTQYHPDIVILMLGTNDTKTYNWSGIDSYISDYREMVYHYQNLPSHPQIYLMTSPPAYTLPGETQVKFSIQNETITQISSALKRLAKEEDIPLIDLNSVLQNHQEYFEEDGVHPNTAGAAQIAQTVYQALRNQESE